MQSDLDKAMAAAGAAEATFNGDVTTVANIKTAIKTATDPLQPALDQEKADAQAYNDSLDAVSKAAQAAKIDLTTL